MAVTFAEANVFGIVESGEECLEEATTLGVLDETEVLANVNVGD